MCPKFVLGCLELPVRRPLWDAVGVRYSHMRRPPLLRLVGTFLLWLGPFALFALAFLVGIIFFRRQKAALNRPRVALALNREERERLDKLLKD